MDTLHEAREGSLRPPRSEQVLDALKRILASDDFVASDRNKRFLSYVVEETLAGRAERLKGYTIAVQVFGRDDSFDAQADPLVRIEARRLRQALERYYLTAGAGDLVRISIPRGGYVPVFDKLVAAHQNAGLPEPAPSGEPPQHRPFRRPHKVLAAGLASGAAVVVLGFLVQLVEEPFRREPASPPATPSRLLTMGPTIEVQALKNVDGSTAVDGFRIGLAAELTHALERFKMVQVISSHSETGSGSAPSKRIGPSQIAADYILKGSVRPIGHHVRVVVELEDSGRGALLWTHVFDRDPSSNSPLAVQSEIASRVAMTLGDPYDVLFSNEVKKARTSGSKASPHYACFLRFYDYWLNPTPAEHQALRDCHERGVKPVPLDAGLLTNLAWLYLDEHRFDFNRVKDTDAALERAAEAARRAVSLQPDSARAHLATAIVQWFRKDFRSFERHADLALSLNPNDTTINAELGLRYGLRGDWARSKPLIDRAVSRDPIRWQTYRVSYAQHAVETGDFERALEELRLPKLADHPALKVTRAAVYGHLNRFAEAQAEWDAARRAMPGLAERPREWIDDRSPSPTLRQRIFEGLERAGLIEAEQAF